MRFKIIFLLTVKSGVSSSTFVNITANGENILTFKPMDKSYKFLLSNAGMTKGATYGIYTGDSYKGGTAIADIVYSNGNYSGETLKKSGTMSATSTVNNISF